MTKARKPPGRFSWVKWMFIIPIVLFMAVQAYFFVQIWWWVDHNPTMTSFMREQQSALREKNPKANIQQQWVPYERISSNLKRAIIASEDANFNDHEGVDWDALEKAYERNQKRKKVTHGGSTITQQLAKNLFLSGSRSYIRKGQELIITYMLETLMDKQRIFEIYLNVVEFGKGTFGAEAAAKHYYGIPASRLNAAQAARLAVMLPNPRYYDAHRDTNYLNRRTATILKRMNSAEVPR
ncbi:monofunctional biosynthetic peptidoglycan transglycosylase [Pseudoduganella rhizocola]|uniref:monofunctional biosynthetic peptidoglycan transglycosylase n=1 Tax=Pseudoduganella rhizocola TaxID=3382643 RepID=UPI0038B4DFE2